MVRLIGWGDLWLDARPCSHRPLQMIEVSCPGPDGNVWSCRYTMELIKENANGSSIT